VDEAQLTVAVLQHHPRRRPAEQFGGIVRVGQVAGPGRQLGVEAQPDRGAHGQQVPAAWAHPVDPAQDQLEDVLGQGQRV